MIGIVVAAIVRAIRNAKIRIPMLPYLIEYEDFTQKTKFAAKNAAFCEAVNRGERFALYMTTSLPYRGAKEDQLYLSAETLWYGLVVMEGGGGLPLPLFLKAAGMADVHTPTTAPGFVALMNKCFGRQFVGISFTPYIGEDQRREALDTAQWMCSEEYKREPAPFTVPNRA